MVESGIKIQGFKKILFNDWDKSEWSGDDSFCLEIGDSIDESSISASLIRVKIVQRTKTVSRIKPSKDQIETSFQKKNDNP